MGETSSPTVSTPSTIPPELGINITLIIELDGDCSSLTDSQKMSLLENVLDTLKGNFTIYNPTLTCGSILVTATFNVATNTEAGDLQDSVGQSLNASPPQLDNTTYSFIGSEVKQANAMESKGSSGLSEADKIIIICVCVGAGLLIIILLLFIIYICNRRKYTRKFDLGVTPIQSSFEDFTLQKMDRPMPYYHDQGLILPQELPIAEDKPKPGYNILNGKDSKNHDLHRGSRENLVFMNDKNNSNAYSGIDNPSFCDKSSVNASNASTDLADGRLSPSAGSSGTQSAGERSHSPGSAGSRRPLNEAATAF